MIIPVAVAGNKIKTVCSCVLSFIRFRWKCFMKDCHRNAAASGFFIVRSIATVLRTIVRTHDCGCAEGKRFILTQGGRMREGATPSDKRAIRLIDCCRDRFSGPINKAVALDKGLTPSRTPQRGDV